MTTARPRWENDALGHGVADGMAHVPEVRRLLDAMAAPGWVAEDPDAHLLPGLRRFCNEPGSPWTLRADAFALIGAVAESSTYVRQCMAGAEIQFEVTTGMLEGDAGFG